MGLLKISCSCGRTWEVYGHQVKDKFANQCPHCFSAIDRQTWDNQIIPAFGETQDANRELMKDSMGYHKPLFQVEFLV